MSPFLLVVPYWAAKPWLKLCDLRLENSSLCFSAWLLLPDPRTLLSLRCHSSTPLPTLPASFGSPLDELKNVEVSSEMKERRWHRKRNREGDRDRKICKDACRETKKQQKADVPERQRMTRGWVGTRIHSHRLLSLNIVLLLMKPWAGY